MRRLFMRPMASLATAAIVSMLCFSGSFQARLLAWQDDYSDYESESEDQEQLAAMDMEQAEAAENAPHHDAEEGTDEAEAGASDAAEGAAMGDVDASAMGASCGDGGCGTSCCGDDCGGCDACCEPCECDLACCDCECWPYGYSWVHAEYLLWWTKEPGAPALISSSPVGTPQSQAGVLGIPGTRVLLDGDGIGNDIRSGGRIWFGTWLDDCRTVGIEGDYLGLDGGRRNFDYIGTPTNILARPFYNIQTGQQDSELINYPGLLQGSARVHYDSSLQGGGLRFLYNVCCEELCQSECFSDCYRVDLIGGYRYMNLNESLSVSENLLSTSNTGLIPQGTSLNILDQFNVDNNFHGVDMGIWMRYFNREKWSVNMLSRIAFGNNHEATTVSGSTIVAVPNVGVSLRNQGLLALPTNIGRYTKDKFAVIPELNLNVGYFWTERLQTTLGYSVVYWSSVVRPGDQIDPVLNTSQLSGPLNGFARPRYHFNETDFWAQGFTFGVSYNF